MLASISKTKIVCDIFSRKNNLIKQKKNIKKKFINNLVCGFTR
jgi:hypothetical protein